MTSPLSAISFPSYRESPRIATSLDAPNRKAPPNRYTMTGRFFDTDGEKKSSSSQHYWRGFSCLFNQLSESELLSNVLQMLLWSNCIEVNGKTSNFSLQIQERLWGNMMVMWQMEAEGINRLLCNVKCELLKPVKNPLNTYKLLFKGFEGNNNTSYFLIIISLKSLKLWDNQQKKYLKRNSNTCVTHILVPVERRCSGRDSPRCPGFLSAAASPAGSDPDIQSPSGLLETTNIWICFLCLSTVSLLLSLFSLLTFISLVESFRFITSLIHL